jgi:hypothetical protein
MSKTIEMAREAGINHWTCEFYGEELKAFEALVRADEREACAKVCENVVSNEGYVQSKWCVDAIRARGQA